MQSMRVIRLLLTLALILPALIAPAPRLLAQEMPPPQPQGADDGPTDYATAANYTNRTNPANIVFTEDFERADLQPPNATCDVSNLTAKGWTLDYRAGYCWAHSANAGSNGAGGNGTLVYIGGGALNTASTLISPMLDLSSATAVTLRFNTFFWITNDVCTAPDNPDCSRGNVLVRIASGDWTPVKSYVQQQQAAGAVTVDLTQIAAGKSQVELGFDFAAPVGNGLWFLDDIQVEATAPPPAPTNLTATAEGADKINLSWQQTANASGYEVQVSPTGTDQWSTLTTIGNFTQTSFSHGVQCGQTFYYRVLAINNSGKSTPSAVANATSGACTTGPILEENFTSGTLPAGWTTVAHPEFQSGNAIFGAWFANNPRGRGDAAGQTTGFLISDRANDQAGWWQTDLRSPLLDLQNYAGVELSFTTVLKSTWATQAFVEVSSDNGSTWQPVWSTKEGSEFSGPVTVNISEQVARRNNVQIRFRHDFGAEDKYWLIDNVKVTGATNPPTKPTLTLSNDSLDVLLNWRSDASTTRVAVERSDNGGQSWVAIGEYAANVTATVDKTTLPATTYRYRAKARNGAGETISDVKTIALGHEPAFADLKVGIYYTPDATRQSQFEGIFSHFADAIYEASNGGVKIRKVTFYPNHLAGDMDLLWMNDCDTPQTYGLIYIPGMHKDAQGQCTEQNDYATNQQQTGYLVAHEFGHYYFHLEDAYCPRYADRNCSEPLATPYSLMTNLFNFGIFAGPSPDYRWLNFATTENYKTASVTLPIYGQQRVIKSYKPAEYGAWSEWEALAKPKSATGVPTNPWVPAYYNPRLTAFAPTAGSMAPIELPASQQAARSALVACWGDTCRKLGQSAAIQTSTTPNPDSTAAATPLATVANTRVLLIERASESTSADQLADAKSAAQRLIDNLAFGSQVAVLTFDGTVSVVQPRLRLDSQTTKNAVKSTIAGIALGNESVALGDALQAAHTAILTDNDLVGAGTAVYLIGSGVTSSGATPIAAITAYSADSLPLFTFGYGATADSTATLQLLASQVGGEYYAVSSGLGSLLRGLAEAERLLASNQLITLKRGSVALDPNNPLHITLAVDDGLSEIHFNVVYQGNGSTTTLTAVAPDNSTHPLDNCATLSRAEGDRHLCSLTVSAPQAGQWQLQGTTDSAIATNYWIQGTLANGISSFQATLNAPDDFLITYPKPIRLLATAGKDGLLVTGMHVVGTLIDPYGTAVDLPFNDDGVSPDQTAGDGLYTALYAAQINGDYQINVGMDTAQGNGVLTNLALTTEPELVEGENGELNIIFPEVIAETVQTRFERYADLVLTVTGAPIIGPNGERSGDTGPTALTPNNSPTTGRISSTERSLRYKVTIPADAPDEYVLRVTDLELGMNPVVNLVSQDERWARTATLANGATGILVGLGVAPGAAVYIEVSHADTNATDGLFTISAGPRLPSDTSDLPATNEFTPRLPDGAQTSTIFLPVVQK